MSIFRPKPIREEIVNRVIKHIREENGIAQVHGTDNAEYNQAASRTEEVMRKARKAERQEAKRRLLSGSFDI